MPPVAMPACRAKENRLVNLRDMPKKPKTVYALFRDDIKEEVPSGKGEGAPGRHHRQATDLQGEAVDKAWKLKYKQKEAELRASYDEEMKSYKEGDTYKAGCTEFTKTSGKIKKEMLTEAMKVMTLKFLNDAPKEPPKTAFAIYVGEKRRQSEPDGAPKKKSRSEAKEQAHANATAERSSEGSMTWRGPRAACPVNLRSPEFAPQKMIRSPVQETQNVYDEKRKEIVKTWTEEVTEYMQLPKWKDLQLLISAEVHIPGIFMGFT
eukprot:Skav200870  [mRNA]  locus=scaffold3562:101031:105775:- [translate_table: standard]